MAERADLKVASNAYGIASVLKNLAPLLAVYWAAPYVADRSLALAWALTPIVGWLLYRLTMVMHDCGHGTLFSRRCVNLLVGRCLGYLTGVDFFRFRDRHWEHHRSHGVPGDPQGFHYLGLSGMGRAALTWHLLKPLFGLNLRHVYLESALSPANLRKGLQTGEIVALLAVQLGALVVLTGAGRHLSLALMPFVGAATVGLFLSQLRGIAEHGVRDGADPEGFVRSHRTDWLGKLLLYDVHFNFHEEHHRYPGVPSCHLPQLFEERHEIGAPRRTMWRTLTRMVTAP